MSQFIYLVFNLRFVSDTQMRLFSLAKNYLYVSPV